MSSSISSDSFLGQYTPSEKLNVVDSKSLTETALTDLLPRKY